MRTKQSQKIKYWFWAFWAVLALAVLAITFIADKTNYDKEMDETNNERVTYD